MEGKCKLHGKGKYLYVKSAGAKLCKDCVDAGLYKENYREEMMLMYPQYYPKTPVAVADH